MLRAERGGMTPAGCKALTPEYQRIQELEVRIRRITREKDTLNLGQIHVSAFIPARSAVPMGLEKIEQKRCTEQTLNGS
jgi:hypothetical protein